MERNDYLKMLVEETHGVIADFSGNPPYTF